MNAILSRICYVLFFCNLFFGARAQGNDVIIRVKFATTPSQASSSFTGLKYGKHCFYNIEVDDNSISFRDLMNYFQGGIVSIDGQAYPGKFFTDGCGNKVPYTASVAINVRSHHWPPNQPDGMLVMESGIPDCIEVSDLVRAVQTGCYPAPHGYYHDMAGYYVQNNFDQAKNIRECANYIWQKTQFVPRVFITPNADGGYNPFLEAQGYFGNSSTGVTDGYPQSPTLENIWRTGISDVSEAENGGFRAYLRDFLDNWTDQKELNQLKDKITALKNASGVTSNKFRRVGTHGFGGANWPFFKSFIDHIESTSQDAIWVTTLQEALEYLETKRKLIKTEMLQGNELTIRLNYTEIPAANLHRDITLQVKSDATIQSITIEGSQRSTYNLATGMINVFNKRSASTAPLGVLPLKLVAFTGRIENSVTTLQWQTAGEEGIDRYEIERSSNGAAFTRLGLVPAKSQQSNTYSFEDKQVLQNDPVYYRVKIVNTTEGYQHSAILQLRKPSKAFSILVSPNPVQQQIHLHIESMTDQKTKVTILNQAGQIIHTQNLQVYKGSSMHVLSHSKLTKGNYTLKVQKESGENKTIKCLVL